MGAVIRKRTFAFYECTKPTPEENPSQKDRLFSSKSAVGKGKRTGFFGGPEVHWTKGEQGGSSGLERINMRRQVTM